MTLRVVTVILLWQSLFMNSFAAESPGDAPITEQAAVEMTVRNNPGLAEMQTRAIAAAAIPSQAGTLPDPMLSFNAVNLPTNTFNLSQEPMTQLQIGLSQAIPFPGKLALRSYSGVAFPSLSRTSRRCTALTSGLLWRCVRKPCSTRQKR